MLFLSQYIKNEESPKYFCVFFFFSILSRASIALSSNIRAVDSLNLHDASQNLVKQYLDKNNVYPECVASIIADPRYQF